MDIIQLLPDSVANQIAAGEVIQRPASVIKELVENAIDAGAKNIQVLVSDAGRTSIQVIDDGCGMSDTDARLSFERHATSKIREAQDLFSLHTMGFRGEALASIAAVARVTLQTRKEEDEVGTRIVIAGSRVESQEVVACPKGSNFLIENLFYNIPARRKFLKSNSTELSNITQAFERIVLVYPEISFSLYNNSTLMLQLRACNQHQRIVDVFKRINQELLPVETETTVCTIKGFVAKPEAAKKRGFHQYFFVNGRYMKHPYFHKAVVTAYDRLLPEGEQVSYFLYLTVKPEDIDVNIHPVKTEIKFDNEAVIWQILMAAVRDAIGKFSNVTTIEFDTEGKPDIPVFPASGERNVEAPRMDFNPQYNPFTITPDDNSEADAVSGDFNPGKSSSQRDSGSFSSYQGGGNTRNAPAAKGWEELFGAGNRKPSALNTMGQTDTAPSFFDTDDSEQTIFSSALNSVDTDEMGKNDGFSVDELPSEHYQLNAQYIVTQMSNGMMLVDQNRASQRILFERYMKMMETRTAHTQKVLFPEVVQFPPSYLANIDVIIQELQALGFEISDLGGGSYSVQGVPGGLGGLDAVRLVNDLVADAIDRGMVGEAGAMVSEYRSGVGGYRKSVATYCSEDSPIDSGVKEQLHAILAESLARKAATPYGEILTNDAMDKLLRQLFACKMQRYTHDGKLIISLITMDEIMKRFN